MENNKNHAVYSLTDIKNAMDSGIRLLWVRLPKELCLVDLKSSYYPSDTVAVMNDNQITAKRLLFGEDYTRESHIIGRVIWHISNPKALKEICGE